MRICQQGISPVFPGLQLSHSDHPKKISVSVLWVIFRGSPLVLAVSGHSHFAIIVRGLAAHKTICILLWFRDTNFILGNPIIIPLVFNREFNDWHLQQITQQRLVGSWWFFWQTHINYNSDEMVKKISPIACLRACACKFCIRISVDFGKNVIRFFCGLCFSFGASTSHFRGSISNARVT